MDDRSDRPGGAPVPLWGALLLCVVTAAVTLGIGWALWGDDDDANSRASGSAPVDSATPGAAATAARSAEPADAAGGDWREAEYAKIARLRGGQSLRYFEEVLGTAMFVTTSQDGGLKQHLFQGRDYWVQTISDATGTVLLMAVTACDLEFRPSFAGVVGAFPRLGEIALNTTRMDQSGAEPTTVHYFQSGATANSYFYDEYYFGNPGNYKTYYLGVNDACPAQEFQDVQLPFLDQAYADAPHDASDPVIADLRGAMIANTYAETSIFADEAALGEFQIGADRILTRTAPPFPEE